MHKVNPVKYIGDMIKVKIRTLYGHIVMKYVFWTRVQILLNIKFSNTYFQLLKQKNDILISMIITILLRSSTQL